jgi:hypothetical protein
MLGFTIVTFSHILKGVQQEAGLLDLVLNYSSPSRTEVPLNNVNILEGQGQSFNICNGLYCKHTPGVERV